MKLNKLFLGFAVILGVLFTSCDTDNVGPVYNVSTPNISFEQGTMSVLTADALTLWEKWFIYRSLYR